jgi:hypothetical protein
MTLGERLRRWGQFLPQPMRGLFKHRLLTSSVPRQEKSRFRACLRPTDIFLVGHPRSGNTWLAYLLAILLERGDPAGQVTVANIGSFVPVIHGHDATVSAYEGLSNPRIFRNERPNHPDLYPRTLFVVRDPRSTLVSYYHYYKTLADDGRMTLDAFIGSYLADGCISAFEPRVVRWDHQATEWIHRARNRPVMIVKYEDLHRERKRVLAEVAGFCGLQVSADALASAVERGSLQAMQRAEERHGVEPQHPPDPPSRGWFFRQGATDGWKTELSPAALKAIEDAFRPAMATLGYTAIS